MNERARTLLAAFGASLLFSAACPVAPMQDDEQPLDLGALLIETVTFGVVTGGLQDSFACEPDGAEECQTDEEELALPSGDGTDSTSVRATAGPIPEVIGRIEVSFQQQGAAVIAQSADVDVTFDSFPYTFAAEEALLSLSVTQYADAPSLQVGGTLQVVTGQAPSEQVILSLPIDDAQQTFLVPAGGAHVRYRVVDLHVAPAPGAGPIDLDTRLVVSFRVEDAHAPCEMDFECPQSQYCVDGACRDGALGTPCGNGFDCGPGLTCAAGECSDRSPGSRCETDGECSLGCASYNDVCTDGADGAYCDDADDCLDDSACLPISYLQLCSSGGLNAPCRDGDDCDGDLTCFGGSCQNF